MTLNSERFKKPPAHPKETHGILRHSITGLGCEHGWHLQTNHTVVLGKECIPFKTVTYVVLIQKEQSWSLSSKISRGTTAVVGPAIIAGTATNSASIHWQLPLSFLSLFSGALEPLKLSPGFSGRPEGPFTFCSFCPTPLQLWHSWPRLFSEDTWKLTQFKVTQIFNKCGRLNMAPVLWAAPLATPSEFGQSLLLWHRKIAKTAGTGRRMSRFSNPGCPSGLNSVRIATWT